MSECCLGGWAYLGGGQGSSHGILLQGFCLAWNSPAHDWAIQTSTRSSQFTSVKDACLPPSLECTKGSKCLLRAHNYNMSSYTWCEKEQLQGVQVLHVLLLSPADAWKLSMRLQSCGSFSTFWVVIVGHYYFMERSSVGHG